MTTKSEPLCVNYVVLRNSIFLNPGIYHPILTSFIIRIFLKLNKIAYD